MKRGVLIIEKLNQGGTGEKECWNTLLYTTLFLRRIVCAKS
jgi:hypothetical protein